MEVKGAMGMKNTRDLLDGLMDPSGLGQYLEENQEDFSDHSVAELLHDLYQRQNISKAGLARKAGMSEVYLHQVFAGRRQPSRDRLLCLCVSLGADLDQVQVILRQAGYAQLYPRLRRDAVICHGILHGTDLRQINDNLFRANERALF